MAEDLFIYSGKDKLLVKYQSSGAIWYGDFSRLHNPDYDAARPSEREATRVALAFLDKHGLYRG